MEPEEVQAELIEHESSDIAVKVTPAAIVADFDAVESRVRAMVELYDGLTAEAAMGMELDELRNCHAELNGIEKRIGDAKSEVRKQYEVPYKAFEAEVKRIIGIVQSPRLVIKAAISAKEQAIKDDRRIHLEEVYCQFLDDNGLPSFADAVTFDRICERKLWDTCAKNYPVKQYENELCDKVASVMREWQSFKKVQPKLFDPEGAERVFWQTLSSVEAIAHSTEEQERQEAVDALHAEAEPETELAETYVITADMTPSQREKVISFMKRNGIKGKIRKGN